MRGHDDRIVADLDAIAVEIGAGGAGQHDAGAIIAVEHQRLFDRTLGQHDLLGADLPHALARRALRRRREVVCDALAEADEVLVIIADRRGAGQEGDIGHAGQLVDAGLEPFPPGLAIDVGIGFRQQ